MEAHHRLSPQALEWARNFAKGKVSLLRRTLKREPENFPWDWNGFGRLWQFELHYLDALPLLVFSDDSNDNHLALSLLENWSANNRPGTDPGWGPYPLSRRMLNFCRCLAGLERSTPLRRKLIEELSVSIPWLWSFQETHIRANHLMCNLHALLAASILLPGLDFFEERKDELVKAVSQEWKEQFLDDGGHFERSPGYHAMLLRELVELRLILQHGVPSHCTGLHTELNTIVPKGIRFMDHLLHPDGKPSFFHDSNAAMPPFYFGEDHLDLKPGAFEFPDSGFGVLRSKAWYAVLFSGEPGPAYQPGHAHCDGLSIETSYFGHRLFTNSGVAGYGESRDREWMRSADAHSTVVISGKQQHEVWSNFRVGYRGSPGPIVSSDENGALQVSSLFSYSGKTAPSHKRTMSLENGTLRVLDEVSDVEPASFKALYHLHPDTSLDNERLVLLTPAGECSLRLINSRLEVTKTTYMPEFGRRIPRECLVLYPREGGPFGLEVAPDFLGTQTSQ